MTPRVYVVDDDAAMRESLAALVEAAGLAAVTFESGDAFLAACAPTWTGCVVLDIALPGRSGIAVQDALRRRGVALPVVFLTGHGDVPSAVRAMKAGALDFLQKPADSKALLAKIHSALALDAAQRADPDRAALLRARYASLTEREREVMAFAVAGRPNKEIARALGISYRTVEIHRSRVLRKMGARTVLDLAEMARLCVAPKDIGAETR
jgi:FixJ family two-component response regulator